MGWRPVRRRLLGSRLMWLTVVVIAVAVVGYGFVSEANPSPDSGVDASGTVTTSTAVSIAPTAAPAAITTTVATTSSTSTIPPTTTTMPSVTIRTPAGVPIEAIVWEPGTVTCAEVEDHIPIGVDDWGGSIFTGLLIPTWGDNQSLALQYLDDPTCTVDSNAWRFLIKIVLNANLWGNNTDVCNFYKGLADLENPPRNLGSVMSLAAPACLNS